mmetsp:Transcript_21876/g.57062  ORF Transcript_21876/g.57062 Transcript_21876/m.57062 type:complete len:144 (-) Transcript_21876:336-767(-)
MMSIPPANTCASPAGYTPPQSPLFARRARSSSSVLDGSPTDRFGELPPVRVTRSGSLCTAEAPPIAAVLGDSGLKRWEGVEDLTASASPHPAMRSPPVRDAWSTIPGGTAAAGPTAGHGESEEGAFPGVAGPSGHLCAAATQQ